MSEAVDWEPTNWDSIEADLMLRSGERCEIQSPACLGTTRMVAGMRLAGFLTSLPRWRRSFHHRRPRGMGGTKRADVDSLAALVNTCGDGTAGCHGYAESYRGWARMRGLLVPNNGDGDPVDPAKVPLVLPSGRMVLLNPDFPWYHDMPGGVTYAAS